MPTRRQFINNSAKLLSTAGIISLPGSAAIAASGVATPNADTIGIALIGCRGMGFGNLSNALKQPNVQCVALCDVDDNILQKRKEDVIAIQKKAPLLYKDYRKLLENKDVDAVIIGTPDHWHCLPFIAACEAGKDIYVEKPLANSIAECDLMVAATRKYKRVVQVGQQQRSGTHWQEAIDFIKAGKIGQLRKVNIWGNFNYGIGQPVVPDSPVPSGVDFDMWLGPAPKRSFNASRFHSNWRMFWDYGGGLMTDWGVHLIDIALWAKDTTVPPLSVTATGGNFAFPDHAHETFDTMSVSYQMKDHVITWEHTAGIQSGPYDQAYGLVFVGNDASLMINRERWEVLPEIKDGKFKTPAIPVQYGRESHEPHMKNFIDCIRSRKDPVCTIENGRLVAMYAHMGNIALRTNSRLVWNESARNFGNNSEANSFITPKYRAPWKLPAV